MARRAMSLWPRKVRKARIASERDRPARGRLGEEDVVVLAAVEGRVEVDEVDGFVLDVLAEDAEIVAVIELVLLGGLHCGVILTRI
jgi:hypothetical protein